MILIYLERTGYVVVSAALLHPCGLPNGAVRLFIQVTAHHSQQRHQIQHGEHTDPDHELHQLVLILLLQRNLHSDPVERYDPGQQQRHSHQDVQTERRQHEPAESVNVVQTHKTHAADVITLDFIQSQQGYG